MTNATPPPINTVPVAAVSINDNLATSSPGPKVTLIVLAGIVAFIAIATLIVIFFQPVVS